jgi:hypothetical protein
MRRIFTPLTFPKQVRASVVNSFPLGSYTIQTYGPCMDACTETTDTIISLLSGDKSTHLSTVDDTGRLSPCDELTIVISVPGDYWVQVSSFNPFVGVGRYGLIVSKLLRVFRFLQLLEKSDDISFNPPCNGMSLFNFSLIARQYLQLLLGTSDTNSDRHVDNNLYACKFI